MAHEPFTNAYRYSNKNIQEQSEQKIGIDIYEIVSKNYYEGKYANFINLLNKRLSDARRDGTWNKYLKYHQNFLYKPRPEAYLDDILSARKELNEQTIKKQLAICQGNSNVKICKIINFKNAQRLTEAQEESQKFWKKIITKLISTDDPVFEEFYNILCEQKFYEANLKIQEWMDIKFIAQLIPMGLSRWDSTSEAEMIIYLHTFEKLKILSDKHPNHIASKHISELYKIKETILARYYDNFYLLDLISGRRNPSNQIEKEFIQVAKDHDKKLLDILKIDIDKEVQDYYESNSH